jgi:hypothetical protein
VGFDPYPTSTNDRHILLAASFRLMEIVVAAVHGKMLVAGLSTEAYK